MSQGWILRPYPHYKDRSKEFLAQGIAAIGWGPIGDIANLAKREVLALLRQHYPERAYRWSSDLGTIIRFRDEMQVDDIVVMVPRLKEAQHVAVGVVTGNYYFDSSAGSIPEPYPHQRRVSWLPERPSRFELPNEAIASMRQGTLNRTYCDVRAYAVARGWLP